MNKIITGVVLLTALYSTAYAGGFFNNNNITPWDTNSWEEDNGIFAYNPYSFFEPRWYIKEAGNFMDEIDEESNKATKHNHNFPAKYEQGNQTSYKN